MKFIDLIKQMELEEFLEKFNNKETFVIKGNQSKFTDLITLDEIENVVNNGCNFSTPLEIIIDGGRKFYVEKNIDEMELIKIVENDWNKLFQESSWLIMCPTNNSVNIISRALQEQKIPHLLNHNKVVKNKYVHNTGHQMEYNHRYYHQKYIVLVVDHMYHLL